MENYAGHNRYDLAFTEHVGFISASYHLAYDNDRSDEERDEFVKQLEDLSQLYADGSYDEARTLAKEQGRRFGEQGSELLKKEFSTLADIISNRKRSDTLCGNQNARKSLDDDL